MLKVKGKNTTIVPTLKFCILNFWHLFILNGNRSVAQFVALLFILHINKYQDYKLQLQNVVLLFTF